MLSYTYEQILIKKNTNDQYQQEQKTLKTKQIHCAQSFLTKSEFFKKLKKKNTNIFLGISECNEQKVQFLMYIFEKVLKIQNS